MTNTDTRTRRQILASTANAISHFIIHSNPYGDPVDKLDTTIWHIKNLAAALQVQYEDLKEAEAAKAEAAAENTTTEPDTESIF